MGLRSEDDKLLSHSRHSDHPAKRRTYLSVALLLASFVTILSACSGMPQHRMTIGFASDAILSAQVSSWHRADDEALTLSMSAATALVTDAVNTLDPDDPESLERAFVRLVGQDDIELAGIVLQYFEPTAGFADGQLALTEYALATENLDQTRELAWAGASAFESERNAFIRLWYQSYVAEDGFLPEDILTVVPGEHVDEISRLGGGTSITLRFRQDGDTVGAFKPYQRRLWSSYRGELAAYRLCPLINCDFDIPHNREVRIPLSDFLDLYGIRSLRGQSGYASEFHNLVLFEDETGAQWLHGVLKDWVPDFTRFPVEYQDVWLPLLQQTTPLEDIEQLPLEEALLGLQTLHRGNYERIIAYASGMTTVELARQLSNLHVFDHLTNNWDRYSRTTRFNGMNNQFNDGRFVSIDNGAAFGHPENGRISPAPEHRVRQIQRFSHTMVDAIRWMDLKILYPILFPPSPHHTDELERFQLFMERRQVFLDYVDELIEQYGEEEVLVFE